ncbi:hypothetical protein Tco_1358800 [Tanacetum coccineum]
MISWTSVSADTALLIAAVSMVAAILLSAWAVSILIGGWRSGIFACISLAPSSVSFDHYIGFAYDINTILLLVLTVHVFFLRWLTVVLGSPLILRLDHSVLGKEHALPRLAMKENEPKKSPNTLQC